MTTAVATDCTDWHVCSDSYHSYSNSYMISLSYCHSLKAIVGFAFVYQSINWLYETRAENGLKRVRKYCKNVCKALISEKQWQKRVRNSGNRIDSRLNGRQIQTDWNELKYNCYEKSCCIRRVNGVCNDWRTHTLYWRPVTLTVCVCEARRERSIGCHRCQRLSNDSTAEDNVLFGSDSRASSQTSVRAEQRPGVNREWPSSAANRDLLLS